MGQIEPFLKELKDHGIGIKLKGSDIELTVTSGGIEKSILSKILSNKADIVKFLKENSFRQGNKVIPLAKGAASYPISNGQYSLWVLSQTKEGAIAYNMPMSVRIKRILNISNFNEAIRLTVNKHESLRTVFKENDTGEVRQWILDSKESNFLFQHIKIDCEVSSQAELNDLIYKDSINSFNLEQGPLLRVYLFELGKEDFVFYFNMHHIISDGWSMKIFLSDIYQFYHSIEVGNFITQSNSGPQYKDYVVWEKGLRNTHGNTNDEKYWLDQFKSEIPKLNLPIANARPRVRTYNGKGVLTGLPKDITDELQKLSKCTGSTIFMILLACLRVLLYRYSGNDDIVIGTPLSGRNHPDLENQIGYFIKTIAIRSKIKGSEGFISVLEQVRKKFLEAYEHQNYPFDMLVEKLELPVDISRNQLFDVMVVYQNMLDGSESFFHESESITPDNITELPSRPCKFDQLFTFSESDEGINIVLEFNSDLYDIGVMRLMLMHFKNVIRKALSSLTMPVGKLDYLLKDEKRKLLVDFKNTSKRFNNLTTIIEQFELQVQRDPEKLCVIFENKLLTYDQVNKLSNQLGHFLQECYSIGPDDIIGINLDRSERLIIAILSVLKAGGAYLPIDASYPQERQEFIIGDSKCKLILNDELLERFSIDRKKYSQENVTNVSISSNLVYVIYTSGTSGNPKGIMMENKSLVNLIDFQSNAVSPKSVLQFASYSFDVSFQEIFSALLNGASLHIISDELRKDSTQLFDYIASNEIDTIYLPTAFFKAVMDDDVFVKEVLKKVKVICVAGEQMLLSKSFIDSLKESNVQLYNHYGPAETHVVTSYLVNLNSRSISQTPSIGKPIQNNEIFILDEFQNIVPINIVGEICISGANVSRGYINNEELTNKKFVKCHYNDNLMYKSGDLGKWKEDGTIEFVGRKDFQVKVRGYRIEPGEIENTLRSNLKIDDAAVVIHKNENNENIIIGYFVSNHPVDLTTVKESLSLKLPDYMIPDQLIQVDQLPLTANGKLDKGKLPIPNRNISTFQTLNLAETETEKRLVFIWQSILGIDDFSIDDDFFLLGGNSLRAIKLISEIYRGFGKRIKLETLFKHTTLRKLASYIDGRKETFKFNQIPKAVEKSSYEASPTQQRFFIIQNLNKSSIAHNLTYPVVLKGITSVDHLQFCFQELIKRHEAFRTKFILDKGRIVQIIEDRVDFYLEYNIAGNESLAELVANFKKPFNLDCTPLIRAGLYRLNANELLLIVDIHHIISDGISINLFINELSELYSGNPLPDLQVQYKDFSEWQKGNFQSSEFLKQEMYWLNEFQTLPPEVKLPFDYTRPDVLTNDGNTLNYIIAKDQFDIYLKFAQDHKITPYMLFLSAYFVLISKLSYQSEITIGIPVSGRPDASLNKVIGVFINVLPLRVNLKDKFTLGEFLEIVKGKLLLSLDNQDYPFDRLIEKLRLHPTLNRTPIFDIMFDYHNEFEDPWKKGDEGFHMQAVKFDNHISLYDLNLHLWQLSDHMVINFDYKIQLFEKGTCEVFLKQYLALLNLIVDAPTTVISDIELTSLLSKDSIQEIEEFDFNF